MSLVIINYICYVPSGGKKSQLGCFMVSHATASEIKDS